MKNHLLKKLLLASAVFCAVVFVCVARPAVAEEGGSGHYFPGSISDFADAVPASPSFTVRYNQIYYSGAAGANRPIPIGGTTALGLVATSWGEGLTLVWRPYIDMGKHWSYAMSATIPFMQMSVSASAILPIPTGNGTSLLTTVSRTGTRNALGDVVLMPLMINYAVNPNFSVNGRVGIYLPTGDYAVGRLANTGKNYTTLEPELGLQYFGQKNGHEAVLYTGFDFNSTNQATQYSGTQFHLDGTLAQHLPLFKGLAGIGVNPFYYTQLVGDSGPGATLGKFEGTTAGIGPVLSYLKPKGKNGHFDFIADVKWLNEYYVKNRLQGNTVFIKVLFKFQQQG